MHQSCRIKVILGWKWTASEFIPITKLILQVADASLMNSEISTDIQYTISVPQMWRTCQATINIIAFDEQLWSIFITIQATHIWFHIDVSRVGRTKWMYK